MWTICKPEGQGSYGEECEIPVIKRMTSNLSAGECEPIYPWIWLYVRCMDRRPFLRQ